MKSMSLILAATSLAAFSITLVPASAVADNAGPSVTYAQDVAPILNSSCVECHRPGQVAPMSLLNYKEVRPWAKSIRRAVSERTMPPWFAEAGHQNYSNDLSISEAEIATLVAWVDQGARAGDLSAAPPTPKFRKDSEWRIGTPDHVFTMNPYEVSDAIEDHYEHVTFKSDIAEDRWVKAIELKPGFAEAVQHILVFVAAEGEDPWQQMQKTRLFAKWGPGNNPTIFAPDHGKLLPANAEIMFQVHYHKNPDPGSGGIDESKMAVIFADGPVKHPVSTAWILDPTIRIPAGDSNFRSESVFRFIDNGHIYNLAPHMHLRGKAFQYIAEYPDGTEEVLLNLPSWDFNWQFTYDLTEPKFIPRGTKIRAVAWFDNSGDNPDNPDPGVEVTWGDATTDEMMIGFMDYTYVKRKKYQRTVALPEGLAEGHFGGDFGNGQGSSGGQ